jgi:hypothetical protein
MSASTIWNPKLEVSVYSGSKKKMTKTKKKMTKKKGYGKKGKYTKNGMGA